MHQHIGVLYIDVLAEAFSTLSSRHTDMARAVQLLDTMATQDIDIRQSCMVCNSAATQVCLNCKVAHCPQHLLGRSCAGCSSQLWLLQAKHVRWLGFLYALVAIPIFAFSMFYLGPDISYGVVIPGLVLGSFALPKLSRPLLDRVSARKALPPTSQAMQLTH